MDDVIAAVALLADSGETAVLSSLVASSGSIPMSARAKMLVAADGTVLGTIGGGCLEAEILAVAGDVRGSGRPQITSYTMTEKQAGEHGLNCGGTVKIFSELVDATVGRFYADIESARKCRASCALVTALDDSARLFFGSQGKRRGSLGADLNDEVLPWVQDCLQRESPALHATGEAARGLFVEPFAPPPLLYVFGGGHVGGQIAKLAHNAGFYVVIVDDRSYFANAERHPDVDECLADETEAIFARIPIDEHTYIVAATRGHANDEVVVEQAIRTPACYVGMLGSERKKLTLWNRIEARGGCRSKLDEVYAPVGFNIGADTPEEIAICVVGEMIQVRRGAKKKWKTKRTNTASAVATDE
jgi:xanthine dehydrogenase accessory factor